MHIDTVILESNHFLPRHTDRYFFFPEAEMLIDYWAYQSRYQVQLHDSLNFAVRPKWVENYELNVSCWC